jgi:riboflavin kinase/FMN adenylyltransferase
MRLFRHYTPLPPDARGAVLALGNFDGVHLGHQAVIGAAGDIARTLGAPHGVLTFEPHPRHVFRPADPPFRLTPFRVKATQIEALGVDVMVTLHFDAEFARRSAEDFVQTVLRDGLGVRHILVGDDFVFGHGRKGTVALLTDMAVSCGFAVTTVPPVALPGTSAGAGAGGIGEVVSSTRVREHLAAGRPTAAAALLGRPWEIDGRVEAGDQRGRTIGFPTANLALGEYLRPAGGVYAVRAGIEEAGRTSWHDAVANLGTRPTVGGTDLRLEVHLFDFAGDLYGRHLRVALVEHLRPEMKFPGLDALKAQIAADSARAREILAAAKLPPG